MGVSGNEEQLTIVNPAMAMFKGKSHLGMPSALKWGVGVSQNIKHGEKVMNPSNLWGL